MSGATRSPRLVGSGSTIAPAASGVDDSDVLNALLAAGGGVVLRAGQIYKVRLTQNPLFAGFYSGLRLPGNTHLDLNGATVKLIDGQTQDGSVIANLHLDAATLDENLRVTNGIVDGNGANQAGRLHNGIAWSRVRGAHHYGVMVKNARGTANFPPGETFQFTATLSSDISYALCEALGTAGTQGSGFGSNFCTNVSRESCLARGMSAGMGYADWKSRLVANSDCVAQKCGTHGFNAEFCERYLCTGCIAGGRATADDGTAVPFAPNETLGNGGSGFLLNETVLAALSGCTASYNDTGLGTVKGASDASVVAAGCSFTHNAYGVSLSNPASVDTCIGPSNLVAHNTTQNWNIAGGGPGAFGGTGNPSPHAPFSIPASGVNTTNPYPFSILVALAHTGTNFVIVDGVNYGTPSLIRLPPGVVYQFNYSVAPTITSLFAFPI